MKRLSSMLLTLSMALISFNASAQAPGYGGYAQPYNQSYQQYPNYSQQSPAQLLELGINVLQNYMKSGEVPNQDTIIAFLDIQISPFFDFEQMARWSAGYHYQRMNSAQQYIFQSNLKKLFFTAFARIVSAYGDAQPRVEFLAPRRQGYDEVVVTARVIPSTNYPILIDFRFMQGPQGWKIYDVGTNGNSAIAYYRAYFKDLIRNQGYDALAQQ